MLRTSKKNPQVYTDGLQHGWLTDSDSLDLYQKYRMAQSLQTISFSMTVFFNFTSTLKIYLGPLDDS